MRIGLRWPNRGWVAGEILRLTKGGSWGAAGCEVGEFLGRISSDFFALASGWPNDPQVLPYLQNIAEDTHASSWTAIFAAVFYMRHRPDVVDWVFEIAQNRLNDVIAVVRWLEDDPRALDVAKRAAPSGHPNAFEFLEKHVDDPSVRDLIVELSSSPEDYVRDRARAIVDKYNLTSSTQRQT